MSDTTDVMLAHIRSRLNSFARKDELFGLNSYDKARIDELEIALRVINAANRLQMLANSQKLNAIDEHGQLIPSVIKEVR